MAADPKQKDNISVIFKRILNKSMLLVNVVIFLFILFEIVDFFKVYAHKDEQIFDQGRIMEIGIKDSTMRLNDISEEELEMKRAEYAKANGTMVGPEPLAKNRDALVGPEQAGGDMIGPMPDEQADARIEEKKPEKKRVMSYTIEDYKKANLSIIVTAIGMKKDELDDARNLPKEISFAFSPYSDELQKKIDFAARDGREVLLNVMFNPSNYPLKDAGPLSIQANYEEGQNLARFGQTLGLARNYIGLLTNHDEIITSKFDKLSPILKKITESKLFFGFYRTTTNANLENDVKPYATDTFAVDYYIDEDPDPAKIKGILNDVKEDLIIKKKRVVIAMSPNPQTVKIITDWLDENLGDKISIAPISYFVTNN